MLYFLHNTSQAIQDSYCLATKIFEHNANCVKATTSTSVDIIPPDDDETDEIEKPKSLQSLLKQYEKIRWLPTTSITLKAIFLGYLETGEKGFLSKFRDTFFFFAGKVGLARKVFLDAATPKVKQKLQFDCIYNCLLSVCMYKMCTNIFYTTIYFSLVKVNQQFPQQTYYQQPYPQHVIHYQHTK